MRADTCTTDPSANELGERKEVGRTEHDEPLGLLDALRVLLRVTELRNVDLVGLLDLAGSAVADEDGLAAPL